MVLIKKNTERSRCFMFAHLAELRNKAGRALYQLMALEEDWVYLSLPSKSVQ